MAADAIALARRPRLATGAATAEVIDRFRAALAARDIVPPAAGGTGCAGQKGGGSRRPLEGTVKYRQKRYLTFIATLDIMHLSPIPIIVQT